MCNSFYNEHIDTTGNLDIMMPMYNFIEHSDNYSDACGSLWQFKRDESPMNNGNPINIAIIHRHLNTNQVFQEKQLLLLVIIE